MSAVQARETLQQAGPVLAARGVSVGYGQETLLHDFDLHVNAGEIVVLLGASGVGKSSLLRSLAGLQAPRTGEIELSGVPLRRPHPASAFAFQAPNLLPWLNVERNVAFGMSFRHQPALSPAERQARVQQALQEVGLWAQRHHYPAQLSGGMAQRVALARCFARRPRVLLLDEPFSALDEVRRADMQGLLVTLLAEHGTAAVLITHDLDEALLLGDRVLLLGREQGQPGQPARTLHEWTLTLPRPRQAGSEPLARLRMDLLRRLHQTHQLAH